MNNPPVITAIVTRPGLSSNSADLASGGTRRDESLLVGLVLDGRRIAWGKCQPRPRTPYGAVERPYPDPFMAASAEAVIQAQIGPLLVGKPATHFRPLVTALDSLTETVLHSKEPPSAAPEEEQLVFSRRALFTGQAGQVRARPAPEPGREQITRPVHPAIRQGVSQAVLVAVALAQNTGPVQVLVEEYGLEPAGTPAPIQVTIRKGQSLALYPQVGALVYAAGGRDPESELGSRTEKLQRFTRILSERVATALPQPPLLVLDVQGGLGRLYGNEPASMGKILGALYGLEQAAHPCPLVVQDPVLLEDPAGQVAAWQRLRKYVQMRGMSTRIAAGEWMHNEDHFALCLAEDAVDSINLSLPALGTLDRVVRAAQRCREHGVDITLGDAETNVLAPLGLAVNAGRVTAPPHLPAGAGVTALYEEMLRGTTRW